MIKYWRPSFFLFEFQLINTFKKYLLIKKLTLFLCYFNFFFCNYQDIDLTVDIPKEIQSNEVVFLSGAICNKAYS
ncbi:hypothetical protein D0T57_15170 [Dysgonomonas sp. 511]|nr:hypothetical protein [Dysgonomonas sp. 511]